MLKLSWTDLLRATVQIFFICKGMSKANSGYCHHWEGSNTVFGWPAHNVTIDHKQQQNCTLSKQKHMNTCQRANNQDTHSWSKQTLLLVSSSIWLDNPCVECLPIEAIGEDRVDTLNRVTVVDIVNIVNIDNFVVDRNNSETLKERTHKLGDHFWWGWNLRLIYLLISFDVYKKKYNWHNALF